MDPSELAREKLAKEAKVREKVDDKGNRWIKVYFGGGSHFQNWLEQAKELGEVEVEEINSDGLRCFEETGEKLYRIWLKVREEEGPTILLDELYFTAT